MKHSFDTHKYIKALVAQGMQETQAEVIIDSIVDARDYDFSKLATKEQMAVIQRDIENIYKEMDSSKAELRKEISNTKIELRKEIENTKIELRKEIESVRIELKKDNELLRHELRAEIANVKYDILKWIIPLMLSNTIAIFGIIVTMIYKG